MRINKNLFEKLQNWRFSGCTTSSAARKTVCLFGLNDPETANEQVGFRKTVL